MPRKLTREMVEESRTRHFVGKESFASLARIFHVSPTTVRKAVLGETHKNVPVTYRRPST